MKSARHYLDQASYMRDLARSTEIDAFRASCLRAAMKYESLARGQEQQCSAEQRKQA
jgi:hypothetical protein